MDDSITRREFEQYSTRMDDHNKRQDARLGELEASVKQITDLTLSVQRLADNMEQMLTTQRSIGDRLKAIEDEPRETIKTVRAAVLSAIGGAVAAAVVAAVIAFI